MALLAGHCSVLKAVCACWQEPTKHQYDYDAATTIAFLKQYGLDKDFKLNLETNHAQLAGHSMEHEMEVGSWV